MELPPDLARTVSIPPKNAGWVTSPCMTAVLTLNGRHLFTPCKDATIAMFDFQNLSKSSKPLTYLTGHEMPTSAHCLAVFEDKFNHSWLLSANKRRVLMWGPFPRDISEDDLEGMSPRQEIKKVL
eukprot:m.236651 g.236651  ORF g.236651 m.236651 type:complete len:125 (-) comp26550_c0_seq4:3606-3980(-)